MRAQVLTHMSEFDIRIQSTTEVHEIITVLHGPGRVRDEHAYACVCLGKNHALDDLEKLGIVVDAGFEVMRKDRNFAVCFAGNFNGRFPHFFARRDDPTFSLLSCLFHVRHISRETRSHSANCVTF